MQPTKSILNPEFSYTPAAKTDLRKKFRAIRRKQESERKAREAEASVPNLAKYRRMG